MARERDYKGEYQRRIANAAKRGLSRSQARGHARKDEAPIKRRRVGEDEKAEAALKLYRQTRNQAAAAKALNISPERFRRYLRETVEVSGRGRTLEIIDTRQRDMKVISGGRVHELRLLDFDQSSLNGEYLNAVRKFLRTNDRQLLLPFEGRSVIDAKGKAHPLETDPNILHRIAAQGDEVFHEIYRLIPIGG